MKKQLAIAGLCSIILSSVPLLTSVDSTVLAEEKEAKQSVLMNALNKESKEVKDCWEKNGLLPSILMALQILNTDYGLNPSGFSLADFVRVGKQ